MAGRFELPNRGFADPCLTAWLRHHIKKRTRRSAGQQGGRTRREMTAPGWRCRWQDILMGMRRQRWYVAATEPVGIQRVE